MPLPAITLPTIELPFDIPVLLHPPVDHFAVALPVVILLLELFNLVVRRRTLSVLSLMFGVLAIVALGAAYLTGSVDGKEAFDSLSEAGQAELKDHKILGTYLLLASGLLLLLKLLSMITRKAWAKTVYMMFLLVLIAGIFKQGEEGGELVYEHGANVERVKVLDDKVFDLEEALEEAKPQEEDTEETQTPQTETAPKVEVNTADTNQSDVNQTDLNATQDSSNKPIEEHIKEIINVPEKVPGVDTAPQGVPVTPATLEQVKTQTQEKALTVEDMPTQMVQPKIATH